MVLEEISSSSLSVQPYGTIVAANGKTPISNKRSDPHALYVEKTIDFFGSFALISNNVIGPAMMGLPHLVHKAGLLPVIFAVLLVWLCSSLSCTMLADTIASIPGNKHFRQPINFSTAFRLIAGQRWYLATEALFVISCMAQGCSAIVETAQSLDQYIASYVLGKTLGLQLWPSLQLIEWTGSDCHQASDFEDESTLEDCVPFHDAGPMVLTLGYVVTTLLLLPIGRAHLKEAMFLQVLSLLAVFVLLAVFYWEFVDNGFSAAASVPWVGDDMSQLAGVVLFNYAFALTVPAWLIEKKNDVSVNKVVWSSSTMGTVIFLSFAIMGALCFDEVGPNMLIVLASKKMHHITRVSAILFGVIIIGSGVPIFSVIIKSSLLSGGSVHPDVAVFSGAYLPYLLSWGMYQGTLLLKVLGWTGLCVNGLVAFIFPLLLTLKAMQGTVHVPPSLGALLHDTSSSLSAESTLSGNHSDIVSHVSKAEKAAEKVDSPYRTPTKASTKAKVRILSKPIAIPIASTAADLAQDEAISYGTPDSYFQRWARERELQLSMNRTKQPLQSQSRSDFSLDSDEVADTEESRALLLRDEEAEEGFRDDNGEGSGPLSSPQPSARQTLAILHARNTVQPLPHALAAHKSSIVVFLVAVFVAMMFTTVVVDIFAGGEDPDELDPLAALYPSVRPMIAVI